MIDTVIRNLLSNAVKFTPRGGLIEISTVTHAENVMLIVKDNGIGKAPERLDKIFNLDGFHTSKGTEQESGTGFGLQLCHEFIHRNNGNIQVKSTQGRGSEFTIILPAAK